LPFFVGLRWDLGVQEERRRELEFLEKVVPALDVIVQVQQVFRWYTAA
jgi:hypothetical protein